MAKRIAPFNAVYQGLQLTMSYRSQNLPQKKVFFLAYFFPCSVSRTDSPRELHQRYGMTKAQKYSGMPSNHQNYRNRVALAKYRAGYNADKRSGGILVRFRWTLRLMDKNTSHRMYADALSFPAERLPSLFFTLVPESAGRRIREFKRQGRERR